MNIALIDNDFVLRKKHNFPIGCKTWRYYLKELKYV